MHRSKQSGFTLIEISIVLVIIGMIVGAITVGGGLLHSSKITSTISEYGELADGVRQYYDKYGNYPGDIGAGGQTAYDDLLTADEIPDAWAELANKEYVKGSYSGNTETANHGGGSVASYSVFGKNSPAAPLEPVGYQFGTVSDYWKDQLYLRLGSHEHKPSATANTLLQGAILSPGDAKSIDNKMDDGAPFTGKIRILKGQNATTECHTGVSKASGENPTGKVLKSNDVIACNLIYYFDEYTSPNTATVP